MKIATQIGLLSGKTQSCGCLHIETAKNNISNYCKRVDITGQRFGKLIAVKPTSDTKYNSVVWECKCDCGNVTYETVGQLCRKNGTISCGCASSKGNVIINNLLKNTQTNFKAEYSFKDLRGVKGGLLRFDFAIFNTNQSIRYLIEYDGIFHFKQQYSNDSFKTTKIHDERKNEYCKLHNINLIRISYLEKDNIENIIFGLLNEKSVA